MSYCGDPWCSGCGRYGRLRGNAYILERELEKLRENEDHISGGDKITHRARAAKLQGEIKAAKKELNDLLLRDAKARIARLEAAE